ncbi:hypothetical protein BRADI_3g34170v3 [Brachypodium distachyon]|uniref:Uncharacterized protein n=1 Tax=Brachypodium distachyon TaxID=15368 RepID=I1I6F0_BRADI|nr:hypothetical protein BRADI_3g34170v3 [Brachypodium distachyon]
MAYADVRAHRAGLKGELECAVCLSEFDDCDTLRLLPHKRTIDPHPGVQLDLINMSIDPKRGGGRRTGAVEMAVPGAEDEMFEATDGWGSIRHMPSPTSWSTTGKDDGIHQHSRVEATTASACLAQLARVNTCIAKKKIPIDRILAQ